MIMPDPANRGGRIRRHWSLLAGLGLSLAVALAGVWVLPGLLDWSRYRDGIAAFAAQRLGRAVRIGGEVSLQLLPEPVLTAGDVLVEDAGDGIRLRARALRVRVALGPLFRGRVDARELTLQGADLHLPWPPLPGAFDRRARPWIGELKAEIEDSRVSVGGLVFTAVGATLATDPDTGTLSAAGAGQAGARTWQFTARLARPGGDGSAGLDVSLDGQGALRGTGGAFSGRIGGDGALEGRVAGRGPDLSQLMPAPVLAWRGDGRLSATGGLAIADELSLEIGGAPARGAVALRITPEPRLDLSIGAGRLDLDAWLSALLGPNPPGLRTGLPTGIDLSAEAATLAGGTLRRVRGTVDLGGGAVALREVSAVLPGNASFELSGQVAADAPATFDGVARVVAPDLRTTLLWLRPSLPAMPGTLPDGVLRAADLSARVGVDAGQVRVTKLRGAVDSSQVSGSAALRLPKPAAAAPPEAQAAAVPSAETLAAAIAPVAALPVKAASRAGVTAKLTLDRLALGPWTAAAAAAPGLPSAEAASALAALRGLDADVQVSIDAAEWNGKPLGPVAADLQTDANRVLLRRLDAQPPGMRLSLSGQVGDGGRLGDGRFELTAPDVDAIRPWLAAAPPLPAGLDALLRGPGSLVVQASGPPEALAARAVLDVSDLRIDVQPVVNLPAGRWAGGVTLHHPGAPRLLEALGFGSAAPSWLGDGSFSLVGRAAGGGGAIELTGATLAAGALRATGHVALAGGSLTGEVSAETLPLPLVYPRSPDPLPLGWLRGWQASVRLGAGEVLLGLEPALRDASATLTLAGGALTLAQVTGRIAGGAADGTVSGLFRLDAASDPPRAALQGQAGGLGINESLFGTPLDLAAGQADVTLDLTSEGYSPAALLATLGGTATVRVRDGVVAGIDLGRASAALGDANPGTAAGAAAAAGAEPGPEATVEAARAALLSGTTPFSAVDARLEVARGVVGVDAQGLVRGQAGGQVGQARLVGAVDLLGDALDLRLTFDPAASGAEGLPMPGLPTLSLPTLSLPTLGLPTLGLRLSGTAAEPARTPELAELARWLADRPSTATTP